MIRIVNKNVLIYMGDLHSDLLAMNLSTWMLAI